MEDVGGRPFGSYKIKSREELQEKINAYFQDCDENETRKLIGTGQNAGFFDVPDPIPYAWTDLASAVGITRRTLNNYKDTDLFGDIIVAARARINGQWERSLHRLGNNNGVIFAMTNNYSEKDRYVQKQELDLGGQKENPLIVDNQNTTGLTESQIRAVLRAMGKDDKV